MTTPAHNSITAVTNLDFTQPQQFIDIGHSQLAYWRTGTGPDLVFIHGWPLHSATFRDVIPLLAPHFTCHCLDLPGAGHTISSDTTQFTLGHHAQSLRDAFEQLKLTQFGLVAHDSGAAIARHIAAKVPSSVFGLVMGNTEIPGHHPPMLKVLSKTSRMPGGIAMFSKMMRVKSIRHSWLGFGSCFHSPEFVDGPFFDWFVKPLMTSSKVRNGQAKLIQNFNFTWVDQLAELHTKIASPVLLLWGNEDFYFPVEKAKQMINQFPGGAKLIEYEKGKLLIHEEFPDRFAQDCLAFFRGVF